MTVREAGAHFGLANATGLYGPLSSLLEEGLVRKEGSRVFPGLRPVRQRPGSWGERVLQALEEEPGQTVPELTSRFGLKEKSTILYPPIRTLLKHGAIARDGSRYHPVHRIDGALIATV